MRSRIATLGLAAVIAAASCHEKVEPERLPQKIEIDVGVHKLRVEPPEGWLHIDQGREHRFRKGTAQLAIVDRGAVTGAGYAAELRRVHQLWRQGRSADALSAMRRISVGPEMFATHPDHRRFSEKWRLLLKALRDGTGDEVRLDAQYEDLMSELRVIADRTVEELLPGALEPLGFDSQRAIASVESQTVHGRPMAVVETWDKLSHLYSRRYALVLNESSLLVVWTAFGDVEQTGAAFQTLIGSLEFREASQMPE